MANFLWVAVTPDELELPIAVADTARELTAMLGLKGNMVSKIYCLHKKGTFKNSYKYKIYKIKI